VSSDFAELEQRLRRVEDIEEIRALLLAYATHLDAGDHRAYAELFTADGELVAQLGQAKGREAIRALLDEKLGGAALPRRTAFHLVGNSVIAVSGDKATSKALWAYITHDDDGYPVILQLGHYDDELRREDGRWLFARRQISRDLGFSPLRDT
jgi:uncharacterized protein (TIGR02246 family)